MPRPFLLALLAAIPPAAPGAAPAPPSSSCTWTAATGLGGGAVATLPAATKEECCGQCLANAACVAADWNNRTQSGGPSASPMCHLKDCATAQCGMHAEWGLACEPHRGPAPPVPPTPPTPPTPPAPGPSPAPFKPLYEVTFATYTLSGSACQGGDDNIDIFYPSDLSKGPFPVLTYGHGAGGSVKAFAPLIDLVAGMGMIVIGYAQKGKLAGPRAAGCEEWQDMLHAIDGSKAAPQLHPALAHADWTRTGIFGHSFGGENSPPAAAAALQRGGYGLRAMLSSHNLCKDPTSVAAIGNVTVPAMFTTCEKDSPASHVPLKAAFDACPARPKIFANLVGGSHMEPIQNPGGRNNAFDARFLACHVADHKPSCDAIYTNSSESMCQQQDYVECKIVTA